MKYYKFLLVVALLCSNVINGQVKYQIKTQKCIRGVITKAPLSVLYTIQNRTKQDLLIFFIEENNDTLSCVKLLKRKLLRKYGDFSLSMIEWEANMSIENRNTAIPELFVKKLAPKEKFEIAIPFTNSEDEDIALTVTQHLLVCPESVFFNNLIEMPHFIENLQRYDFAYPGKNIVLSASTFRSFILR